MIDLPPLEDKDIRTALIMQAQERIPMPLDRAVMDFHKVGLVDTAEGQRLRVIVVVTEREGVDLLLDTLRRAGLKPEGIDLSVFSAIRSLNHHVAADRGPVLYAQLGDLVNIAIAEAGVCRFTRQAPQGLAMVLGRLAENRGIPLEEAYTLLHTGDGDEPRRRRRHPRGRPAQASGGGARIRAACGGRVLLDPVRIRDRHHRCGRRTVGSAPRVRAVAVGGFGARAHMRRGDRRHLRRLSVTSMPASHRGHGPGGGSAHVMNAVNLIPSDRRKRQVGVSVSPLTLGVIGGLIVVLAAAVLYVAAVNNVRARKSELAARHRQRRQLAGRGQQLRVIHDRRPAAEAAAD